jgi:hypothetical protein
MVNSDRIAERFQLPVDNRWHLWSNENTPRQLNRWVVVDSNRVNVGHDKTSATDISAADDRLVGGILLGRDLSDLRASLHWFDIVRAKTT